MKFGITVVLASILSAARLGAQSPVVNLSSATLILHSETNDSYTLQGTFSGLAFNTSQAVFLTLGQFNVSLLLTDFVQQPGTNIFVYQDKTGQTPYWVSSLTIDLDAQTFNAQATGIALAGLTNPFAVQLGTENGLGCTMARVQSPDGVNFQLTAGDGVNEPCQIDFPQMSQPSFFAGQTTTIQFQVTIPAAGNVDPSSVQLFQVDANAQPVGAPLCNLSANGTAPDGSGIYSCTASFSQDAPGPIPLMVEAAAGGNTLLSPGFSALAVGPMTQADVDAIGNVATAASAAWDENYQAFGDSPQARIQTIDALLGMDGVQEVRLLQDGLSIGVQFTSGLRYTLVLNRLDGQADSTPDVRTSPSPRPVFPAASGRIAPRAAAQALQCGQPQRPLAQNNNVLIWDAGFFSEPNVSSIAMAKFQAVKCPVFNIMRVPATIANAELFPTYGTIIIDTHGTNWNGSESILTSEPVPADLPPDDPRWMSGQVGGIAIGTPPGRPSYWALTPFFFHALGGGITSPFQRTIVFNGACYGAHDTFMGSILGANGGAYFGFTDEVSAPNANPALSAIQGFATIVEPLLLDHLLSQYLSVSDSFNAEDVPKTDPSLLSQFSHNPLFPIPLSSVNAKFVLLPDPGSQLAYLGNPQISAALGTSPYQVPPLISLDLQTQLDGAQSCNGIMSYNWTNTAIGGHLMSGDGTAGPDNFTTTNTDAVYTSNPILPASGSAPIDNLVVNFLPDPANPPAAQACATVDVIPSDQILHVDFVGQGQSSYAFPGGFFQGSANLTWHYAWDMHIPQFQDLQTLYVGGPGAGFYALIDPALSGVTVSGTTTESNASGPTCTGSPVMQGNTGAPFLGVVAIPTNLAIPYPVVRMFVETFGGGVWHLCNGDDIFGFGDQVPGYPGFDPSPSLYMFNLDLSQFLGKTTSMTMPVSGSFQPGPGDTVASGSVTYSGTLTFSTTAGSPSPSSRGTTKSAPAPR